ncbi:MAG: hypothetical protein NTX45_22405 [Proteobacteria bacterium]|nr:hypothetical protein [Pseudomonadota bacterium]
MNIDGIPLEDLRPDDFSEFWLFEYIPSKDGRLWVKPVKAKKIKKFTGRIVASKVILADNSYCSALILGINIETPEFSRHNRELILWIPKLGWFRLAQYFDSNEIKAIRGDDVLCDALEKSLDQVFPISFDLRDRSSIDSPCLTGTFEHDPSWGLSGAEVMQILVDELSQS